MQDTTTDTTTTTRRRPRAPRVLHRFEGFALVVREHPTEYERRVADNVVQCGSAIAKLLRPRAAELDYEVVWMIALDGRNRAKAVVQVAQGGLHGCGVMARDILRAALMAGASAFALAHNHPSGNPCPSIEDVALTRAVIAAANAVGCGARLREAGRNGGRARGRNEELLTMTTKRRPDMTYWLSEGAYDIALMLDDRPTIERIRDEVEQWLARAEDVDETSGDDVARVVARVAEQLDDEDRIAPEVLEAALAAAGGAS